MCNYYESVVIIGRGGRQFKKIMSFLFLFLSLIFSSCQPVTDDFDGGNGSTSTSSGGKHFFTLTVRAANKRSASDSLRATVTYEPEVTWESEQGFRSTVTDFVIKVGNEAPQTVQLGASVSSRGMYTVGSDVTVSYEAYGNVTFKNERGKTETKREVIASESKTVKVAAEGTTVNFKVSKGIKTPESYEETVDDGTVKYSAGIATVGSVSGLPDEKEYAPGETVTPPAQVTWDYGNFNGWTANVDLEVTTPNGTSTVKAGGIISAGSTFTMPADSGVVLTAQWNPTQFTINYNFDTPSSMQGNAQVETQGASTFTMASSSVASSLTTYTDSTGNWAFGGWSTTNGGAKNISSISDIRSAVLAGNLTPTQSQTGGGDSITLYAVWADARTAFTVTVNASAIGLGTTTISNVMNTQDITTQVTQYLTGQSNTTKKYELVQGRTFTADVTQQTITLSNNDVTTKVAVTLGNQLIDATVNSLVIDGALTVNFTDPSSETATSGKWYEVGTSLPTVSLGGNSAQQYAVGNGWRTTGSTTAQTQITEALAGETLYPIGGRQVAVTVTSGNSYTLGNGGANPFYISQSTDITSQVKAFMPADTTTRKFTWNVADSGVIDAGTGTTKTVDIDDYLDVENATNVAIKINGTTIGTVSNKFGGDTISPSDITGFLSNSDVSNKRYGLTSANTNKTYTVTKGMTELDISADVEVKAVKITLSGAAMGVGSGTFTVSIVGNDPHAGDINNAAWYNINESFPDVTVLRDGAPESGYEVSWGLNGSTTYTQIREDMAGQMLQAVLQIKQYTITIEHYKWVGSSWEKIDDSDVSGYDLNPAPPLPDPIDYGCEISSSLLMGMTAIRIEDQQGTANQYSCDGNAALLSANGAAINDLPADGSYATQISPGHTITSDITLYILWK